MSDNTSTLHFPSGLSVDRAKKRAKAALKAGDHQTLTQALDAISIQETGLPWGKAAPSLVMSAEGPVPAVMSRAKILAVMSGCPELTHFGFGSFRGYRKTFAQYLADVERDKASLEEAVDECNKACMYLQHLDRRKTINGEVSSYSLKHAVEHYMRRLGVEDYYVANGAFICAAIHMGFRVERGPNASPNSFINYSSRSPIIRWTRLADVGGLTGRAKRELDQLEQQLGIALPQDG